MNLTKGGEHRKKMRSSLDLGREEGKTRMEGEREPADHTQGTLRALEEELGGWNVLNAKLRSLEERWSAKNAGLLSRVVVSCTRVRVFKRK